MVKEPKRFPSLEDVREAAERIRPYAHRTPVLTCKGINQLAGASLFFKCENLQKVGAFKFRGACNTVFQLSDEECKRGVATHSSGNHAGAIALAARLRGIKATIVMPRTAPSVKRAAVKGYGAEVVLCEPTHKSRQETLDKIVAETGRVYIPSYNDPRVIAGQGTAGLELMEQAPGLDVVMAPVGGAGLISGTAIAVSGVSPDTRIIGGEPKGADDAFKSLRAGKIVLCENPKTVADGLLMPVGDLTFSIIQKHLSEIITVEDDAIISAMRLVWERMKIVIEPSSAVPVAALLKRKADFKGKRVGIILSGGNVDLDSLPWI